MEEDSIDKWNILKEIYRFLVQESNKIDSQILAQSSEISIVNDIGIAFFDQKQYGLNFWTIGDEI